MDNNIVCADGVCYIRPSPLSTKEVPLPTIDGWTVYGAEWCEFCKQATNVLKSKEIAFVYHDIDEYGGAAVKDRLKDLTNNFQTIPMIFDGKTFIGGFTDLCRLI
tara:strand:- start:125 stop:439 length:315 start_codon:yes stop_codon:yes gene_type:complete